MLALNRRTLVLATASLLLPGVAEATPIIGFSRVFTTPFPPGADAFIGAVATRTADSASSNFNNTVLPWDSEIVDTNTFHNNVTSNSRLTIPIALNGRVGVIHSSCELTGVTAASNAYMFIQKNGSETFDGAGLANQQWGSPSGTFGWLSCSTQPVVLATNDFFESVIACNDTTTVLLAVNSHISIEIVQ